MRRPAMLALLAAALAAPAWAGPAPSPAEDLLLLYRTANSWGMSAVRRSCADASLLPRLAGARQRLAAANSVIEFDFAVAHLETALARGRAR